MKTALCLLYLGGALGSAAMAEPPSALDAIKLLPPADAKRLAVIDGHDGSPSPERWHFLVQDPVAENGLREIVVENREIVAEREVSQFATQLTDADVIGKAAVRVDSDRVGTLAQRYAAVNGLAVDSMNFQLRKDPVTEEPVWTVACLDAQGTRLAALQVGSADGRILAHDGFAHEPPAARPGLRTVPKRDLASVDPRSRTPRSGGFHSPAEPAPPAMEGPDDDDSQIPVRRAEPVHRYHIVLPNPVRDVHDFIHRLLPF